MNPATQFLMALGQALSSMALYGEGHPARTATRVRVQQALAAALEGRSGIRYSFLGHDIVCDSARLPDLHGWDWGRKFVRANVRRLEIDAQPAPSDDEIDALLGELHRRVAAPEGTTWPTYLGRGVRCGGLDTLSGVSGPADARAVDLVQALAISSLTEEVDCVRWIHDQASLTDTVPMAEVEAVVRGLAVAMRRHQGFVLPLLALKTQDQYTTTHSCNVAMLSMGLAEAVGLSAADVRAVGTAALLHDIGKVRVSLEVLVKPGKLTEAEYAEMQRHTTEGARLLGERGRGHALAAIVAYEHHLWLNGRRGYPTLRYPRSAHYASRLVHVCDLYDALSTDRPYRSAWPRERTVAMLLEQRGTEVDGELVDAFIQMIRRCEEERLPVEETPVTNDWNAALARTALMYS